MVSLNDKDHKSIKDYSATRPDALISECIRCGKCCIKGGPCFHTEDKNLIEKGVIPLKYLYTIRKGEPADDNVKGCILPVASDIIKIKGVKDSWTCIFFNKKENACKIYKNRPLECRALKCWDTREIENIYSKNRLTRKELLSKIKGLWDLVKDHQERCSYYKLKSLADRLKTAKTDKVIEDLFNVISYDAHIRSLVVENGGMDPEITDFLFGRPLVKTIRMFGLKIKRKDGRYRLAHI